MLGEPARCTHRAGGPRAACCATAGRPSRGSLTLHLPGWGGGSALLLSRRLWGPFRDTEGVPQALPATLCAHPGPLLPTGKGAQHVVPGLTAHPVHFGKRLGPIPRRPPRAGARSRGAPLCRQECGRGPTAPAGRLPPQPLGPEGGALALGTTWATSAGAGAGRVVLSPRPQTQPPAERARRGSSQQTSRWPQLV